MQMDLLEVGMLMQRPPGWTKIAAKLVLRYWLDLPFRLRSPRDRRLTTGNAAIGGLRKAMLDRDIPLLLHTALASLVTEGDRVVGAVARHHGVPRTLKAKHGVVLASGGFEKNEALRRKYLPVDTDIDYSLTPGLNNRGEALQAGIEIGAATEFLEQAWWVPSMRVPAPGFNNADMRAALFMERAFPHTMCVNRKGRRFVNEAISYNDFGAAMLTDKANAPCWLILDATARYQYPIGALLPSFLWPDWRLPREWLDNVFYRASTIGALAEKIGIDPAALSAETARFNSFAVNGVDADFQRGESAYDRIFGDQRNKPNPCLGAIEKSPFYAMRLDIGDIGTKGGLKTDANANVLRANGTAIAGLYATGNVSGAMTFDSYPGAGGTLGPAMTFGMIAAERIAAQNSRAAEKIAS
jgi:3-oxosteroid 1-dehydrogenase